MNDKITIGLFIDTFFPMIDGVTMVVDNYARRLTKYANVIVFAPYMHGKKFDDKTLPYKVVRCKSLNAPIIDYSLPMPKFDRKFIKELNSYHLDIVHIHSPFMLGRCGLHYAKKYKVPSVGTMHSQFKQDFYRATKSKITAKQLTDSVIRKYNRCTECWAVNSAVADIFYNDYGYKTMPKVMNNATDMLPVEDEQEARKYINTKHDLDDKEKVFLFVGRINKLKNIFFIADVIKTIKEKNPDFKFKMLFVGTGQDENELKEWIKENNMQDSIIMCGKVSDRDVLAMYFARADLFLFPSLYDASSIVQIEAASQKTPTLFLKGAATAATVENNVNGFILDQDVNIYADKIIELMQDEKLYKEISNNAFKDLYINWDDTIEQVYKEYMRLIEENKKAKD